MWPCPAYVQWAITRVVASGSASRSGRPRSCAFLVGAIVGAGLAEGSEGGGVAAGLGGEVAPEAEHVSPVPQPAVRVVRVQVPAGFDQAPGVRGEVGELVEFGEFPDTAVYRAGRLGGFGGVLGDVGGDGLFGQVLAVSERADGLHVELCAPAQDPGGLVPGGGHGRPWRDGRRRRRASASRSAVAHGGGGVSGPSGPSKRMTAWKWISAAFLVFGDLAVRDAEAFA